MEITLAKGRSAEKFSIPDDRVISLLKGADIPALALEKVCHIIRDGIIRQAPPGIRHQKVAILVPDDTRLWARGEVLVPVILEALTALGVPDTAITVIIALGTHADMAPEKFTGLVGRTCVERVRIVNAANQHKERLVSLGRTSRGTGLTFTREACEADHVIIFGGVLHHLIAGFGGGRKYILPGIAGYETVQQNHALAFLPDGQPHPGVRQALLTGNPVHEDMAEAARIFLEGRTATYAAVAVNGSGDIFHAAAGPLEETFLAGCDQVDRACAVPIDRLGDFALISAGGHRTDGQLYQSTKALFNAVNAVKPGGKILFVSQARQGVGHPLFGEMLTRYRNHPEKIAAQLAQGFNMPAYVAFRVMDLLKRFHITLVSDFSRQETLDLGFRMTAAVPDYVSRLTGRGYVIPFAENILPTLH